MTQYPLVSRTGTLARRGSAAAMMNADRLNMAATGASTADARLVTPAASPRESADRRCGVAGCAEAMLHHSRR